MEDNNNNNGDNDDDGGWGDLFALASGGGGGQEKGGDGSEDGRRRRDDDGDDDTGGGPKKKKRRKKSKKHHSSMADHPHQKQKQQQPKFQKQMAKYLAGRMDVTEEVEVGQSIIVPSWMFLKKERPGTSLLSSRTGSSSSSSSSSSLRLFDTNNPPYGDEDLCLYSSYSSWPVDLFISIVNLRSISKHVAALLLQSSCINLHQQQTATASSSSSSSSGDDDDSAAPGNTSRGDAIQDDVRDLLKSTSDEMRRLTTFAATTTADDGDKKKVVVVDEDKNPACKDYLDRLLGSCDNLVKTMTGDRNNRNNRGGGDGGGGGGGKEGGQDANDEYELFELSVDVMIKCDDLYFRLYYDQITNNLPPSSYVCRQDKEDEESEGERERDEGDFIFIPHPLQYYRLVQYQSVQQKKQQQRQDDENHSKTSITTSVKNTWGEQIPRHPLEIIYHLREQETIELFDRSGWTQHPKTLQQWSSIRNNKTSGNSNNNDTTISSSSTERKRPSSSSAQEQKQDDEVEQHETPAPSLLRSWRDSNRDFLCHLYCYATVSTEDLMFVTNYLKSEHRTSRMESIIEVGAGTGYLAEVLSKIHGMDVDAYDDVPTTTTAEVIHNEYHGSVPSFRTVNKWSASSSPKDHFPSNYSGSSRALLLCYPPPNSSMAADTLKKALKNSNPTDGLYVIHIGEFKGLTGNREFEHLLQEKYKCIYRQDCLHWGTDASQISVWEFVGSPSYVPRSVLIKCNECRSRESTKRCRYLRTYCLCSRCWSKGDTPKSHGGDDVDSVSDSDSDSDVDKLSKLRWEAEQYQVGCFQNDNQESELEASDFIDLPLDLTVTRPEDPFM